MFIPTDRHLHCCILAMLAQITLYSDFKESLIKSIIAPLSNGFSRGVIDACGFNQRFLKARMQGCKIADYTKGVTEYERKEDISRSGQRVFISQ